MEKLHQLTQQYQELAEFLRQFRQECHRFPELSNEEFETTVKIKTSHHDFRFTIENGVSCRNQRRKSG